MAQNKKKNPSKNKRKAGPLQKRARRDVMFAIDPILDEIKRQQESSEREYEQNASRVAGIYDDLGAELAPVGNAYQKQAQGISGDLNAALGGLAGLLAPSAESANALIPSGDEAAAGVGMFGSIGAGGQTMLASDRSRQLGWDTSLQREVPLQSADYERRFLQDFRDTIDDIQQQRFDTMRDVPSQVLARLDQLRDSKRQNKLAKAELALREQIADREGDRADKAFRQEKKTQNNSVKFAQDELSRREAQKKIKRLTSDIQDLKAQRQPVIRELRDIRSGRTPSELAQTNLDDKLRKRKRKLTSEINQKKRRRKSYR